MRCLLPFSKSSSFKVLIQRADRLGDVIVSLPLVEALHHHFPNIQIDVLVAPIGAAFLKGHPKITTCHEMSIQADGRPKNIMKMAKKIASEKYDVIVHLWSNPKMVHLGYLAGIPYRLLEKGHCLLTPFVTHTVDAHPHDITQHQVERNLQFLAPFGIESKKALCQLYPDEAALDKMRATLTKYLDPSLKSLVIFTATGGSNIPIPFPILRMCLEHLKNDDLNIILLGPKESPSELKAIKQDKLLNLVGQTSLKELEAMIHLADYYLGPDTGPTHIASFAKRPMVFFSPLHSQFPGRWGPRSPLFKIIRREFKDPLKKQSLTGHELASEIRDLEHLHYSGDRWTEEEQERERMKATFRVLVVVRDRCDYDRVFDLCQTFRQDDLYCFPVLFKPWSLRSIFKCLWLVQKRNINAVMGECPPVVMRLIRFFRGTIKQYVAPVFIGDVPFTRHVKAADYIQMIKDEWKKST